MRPEKACVVEGESPASSTQDSGLFPFAAFAPSREILVCSGFCDLRVVACVSSLGRCEHLTPWARVRAAERPRHLGIAGDSYHVFGFGPLGLCVVPVRFWLRR